jgi:pimeloyl-ACP methyl ester carboxylesterase
MRILPGVLLLAVMGGCGMLSVKEQQAKIDASCRLGGRVEAERPADAPLIVVLVRLAGPQWEVADHFVLEGAGRWGFGASPGRYALAAFQDLNRDLKLQPGEPFLRGDAVECAAGEHKADIALRVPAQGRLGSDATLDIAALQVRTYGEQLELSLGQVTAIGEVAGLSDPRFDDSVAEDGLWKPFDFLFVGHPGIYFLGAYDSTKIPVLFVHGINGSPRNFATLIERLDRRRFQPWVYYYPSGAHLGTVADHLAQTMRKLQVQYGFTQFAVVAHSMGGLVARGFLQRYAATGSAQVPLFVSMATPWGGHKGAELGVRTAPAVVRVWIDMAPGSAYQRSLYAQDPGVPHYLFFTMRDGTVTLESQLPAAAQRGAVRVEGYNETHMGVLESRDVAARLNELLSGVR